MVRASRSGSCSFVLATLVACSETVTRPAPLGDCREEGCLDFRPPSIIGVGVGSDGSAGGGGEGGGGGMPPPQTGSLAGSVRVVTEPDLFGSGAPEDPVAVSAAGAAQALVSADVEEDGTFRLEGVLPSAPLWVAVGSFESAGESPYMTTLQPIDSTTPQFVDLLVMPRSVMEEIVSASYLVAAAEIEPSRGHAIVQFVNPDGLALNGVQITVPDSGDAAIAYDAGEIYSDALEQTATRGAAVLLNVPASAYPGSVLPITVELAGVSYSTPVRVASDAVTIAQAIIDVQP